MNIYGASGHGKVVIDIVRSQGMEIGYVIDDNPAIKSVSGFSVVQEIPEEGLDAECVLAIGKNSIRKTIAEKFEGRFSVAIKHSSAVISSSAQLGDGTVIMANANVNSDAIIGKHCIINTGAIVEHDCWLEDYVHISPNATLAGEVSIGEGSHIGAGAVVIPGIKIGKWATVGAGAIIIKDIPDTAVVVGNPGRIIKYKKH